MKDEQTKLLASDEKLNRVADSVGREIDRGIEIVNISSRFLYVLILENLVLRKKLREAHSTIESVELKIGEQSE